VHGRTGRWKGDPKGNLGGKGEKKGKMVGGNRLLVIGKKEMEVGEGGEKGFAKEKGRSGETEECQ